MGLNKREDRRGIVRLYVEKQWPDGTRFKRVAPNTKEGLQLLARIDGAIVNGTWRKLKAELARGDDIKQVPTIEELADRYLREYARVQNRRPDFKEVAIVPIKRIIGHIQVDQFRREDARAFVRTRRTEVAPATVNRSTAVLKNMFTFAMEVGLVETHPLVKFRLLAEPQTGLRVMTLEEERRLVKIAAEIEPTIGAFLAFLGETGARKSEGLRLKWENVDFANGQVTIDGPTKSAKCRYVPLSDFAVRHLRSLTRIVGCPQVFMKPDRTPWVEPREVFDKIRKAADLDWVGLHDLRHFRITQWVKHGIDLRTVKELAGHSDISTTMRYAHFAPKHASKLTREVERAELKELEKVSERLCSENVPTKK